MSAFRSGKVVFAAIVGSCLCAQVSGSTEVADPVVVAKDQAGGPVFSSPQATSAVYSGSRVFDMNVLTSKDGALKSGVYKLTPGHWDFSTGYPLDEFICIIEGSVTLRGVDGREVHANVGDALAVHNGWKGSWETAEDTIYYYSLYAAPKKASAKH
jgi:uncharacterized cupin superfamily protein